MSRAVLLNVVVAIAIVAVVGSAFASIVSGGVAAVPGAPIHSARLSSDVTPAGTAVLKQAVASINAATPHSGSAVPCAVTSGTAASCGSPPPLTHSGAIQLGHYPTATPSASGVATAVSRTGAPHDPTLSAADPAWYNVSANLTAASGGKVPVVGFGARMAFDPLLGEVVLFAGSSYGTTVPYENITWVYNGVSWTNLTASLGPHVPSARAWFGFDFDPARGGVILVGGWTPAGLGLNDTWLFTGTWTNITSTVGPLLTDGGTYLDYGGIGGSGSAWDPALGGFILTDGCSDPNCALDAWSLTWLLNATGWHTIDYGPGFGSFTWLGFTSMAYDPTDGYLVLFGGFDYDSRYPQNYTYTYSGGTEYGNNWVNISASDGCRPACGTPAGRDDFAMTWDAQLGAVFMTGGFNYTHGEYNDSWEFLAGHWHPVSPAAPAAFEPREGPALAVDSTDIGVFLVGGECALGCYSQEWVFEAPPQATLTETPHPIDLGTAVTFSAGWAAGTGTGYTAGWNLSYGNSHFTSVRSANGANTSTAYAKAFPYTYPSSGTFTANVTWTDFFYLSAKSAGVSLTVYPALVATITTSATTISAGGTVTFSTDPTGGSGTYTYAWSFGDGTTSTAEGPPAHTYAKGGTYTVNLSVTDSIGSVVKSSVTITVKAASSSGLSLSGSTLTYLVVGIVALLVVIAAVVLLMRRRKKPTTAQPWQAGAPPAGAGAPPPGAGANIPPGVGGSPPPPSPPP